uniref:MAGE domain-containing protein n=1 Tax=Caenorhabditis tropicalis TaxID=1561998 RepID=A0A1I7TKW5_9PELO
MPPFKKPTKQRLERFNALIAGRLNMKRRRRRSTPEIRESVKNLKSENRTMSDKIINQDEKISKTFQPLNEYTTNQSDYHQRTAVLRCEKYMKSRARTPDAFSHLLNDIVKQAVTKDPSMMRLSTEQTFILETSAKLSDGSLKTIKSLFRKNLGYDVLTTKNSVSEFKKQMGIPSFYSFDVVEKTRLLVNGKEKYKTSIIKILDLQKAIEKRLETLEIQITLFFVCKATKVQKRRSYVFQSKMWRTQSIENVEKMWRKCGELATQSTTRTRGDQEIRCSLPNSVYRSVRRPFS